MVVQRLTSWKGWPDSPSFFHILSLTYPFFHINSIKNLSQDIDPNYTSDINPKSALFIATERGLVHVVDALLKNPSIDIGLSFHRLSFPRRRFQYEEWNHCFGLEKRERIRQLFLEYYMNTDGVAYISSSSKKRRRA